MNIITKKINNKIIFYDSDIGINIEELFSSNVLYTDERKNVEWINDNKWVKKHYFRKGMMSFLHDQYLYSYLNNTRSYREFEILNYLHKHDFNTCKPLIGWVAYNGIMYAANLVTETIQAITLKNLLDSELTKYDNTLLFNKVGIKVAEMHMLNIFHGDLNINNIMISDELTKSGEEEPKVWIIDFDKSHKSQSNLNESYRHCNLRRLRRSFMKTNHYDDGSFNALLEGYQSLIKD